MATIASIAVSLAANTGKFTQGMQKAAKHNKTFRKSTDLAKKSVGALGIAAAAAAGSLAFMTKRQFEAIDATAKMGKRIGISVRELEGLNLAAERTGVSAGTLQMGLQRMTRRVSEAAKGSGEAVKALDELGLSAQRLNSLSPDQQFREISEAMSGVANQSDRVRLAMRLFDSEGVALVNTMKLGAAGLDEMTGRAEMLGLTLSQVEAAQVEAANDAMGDVLTAMSGLARQIAVDIAPLISEMSNRILDFIDDSGGVVNVFLEIKKSVLEFSRRSVGAFGLTLEIMDRIMNAGKLLFVPVELGINAVKTGINSLQMVVDGFINLLLRSTSVALEAAREVAIATRRSEEFIYQIESLSSTVSGLIEDSNERIKGAAQNTADVWTGSAKEIKAAFDALFRSGLSEGAQKQLRTMLMIEEDLRETQRRMEQGGSGARRDTSALDVSGGNVEGSENERIKESLEERMRIYEEFGIRQAELESMQIDGRVQRLAEAREKGIIDEMAYNEAILQMDQEAADARTQVERQAQIAKANAFSDTSQAILSAVSAFGQKSLKIQKAVALAESATAIATGIARAQALGFPANIAEAARVAAVGANVIQTIKGAKIGSGASITPNGQSSGPGADRAQERLQPQVTRQFNVNIAGSSVSKQQVRGLIAQINAETDDNVSLRSN